MKRPTWIPRSLTSVLVVAVASAAFAHDRVPTLPFPNNPDPTLCGIPQPVGEGVTGVLHGRFEGQLIEPEVHLVDSHLRHEVVGHVQSGARIEVLLYQENPELDFYLVRFAGPDGTMEGWVPAPYLRLDEVP